MRRLNKEKIEAFSGVAGVAHLKVNGGDQSSSDCRRVEDSAE